MKILRLIAPALFPAFFISCNNNVKKDEATVPSRTSFFSKLLLQAPIPNGTIRPAFSYEINNFNKATGIKITKTIDTLIALNDSAYLGLDRMKTFVNNASIAAPSYEVVHSIIYNYVHQPAKPGTVTFQYKKIGMATTHAFYVKFIGDSLLQLNSPDSVFTGQILPVQAKAVTYDIFGT